MQLMQNNDDLLSNSQPNSNLISYDQIPKRFLDPLTYELMEDPVITRYHQTYDRKSIECWLKSKKTDPLANKKLTVKDLKPNKYLKSLIDDFKNEINSNQKSNIDKPNILKHEISDSKNISSLSEINPNAFYNHEQRKKTFVRSIYYFIEDLKVYINTHMQDSNVSEKYEFFCVEKTIEALANADDLSFNLTNALKKSNMPDKLISYIKLYVKEDAKINFAKEYYGFSYQIIDLINAKDLKSIKAKAGLKQEENKGNGFCSWFGITSGTKR